MTARENKIRLGLVGCGRATETRHLPALRHLTAAEVVALADIDPGALHNLADRFQIKQRHQDYRRLLDDQSIDAVAVCVPAQYHAEVALAALNARKHVFIEKPLALNLDESDQIIERAAKFSNLTVMVGLNMRWHRLVRQGRAIIQRGTLGRIESIRTVLTSYHANVPEWRSRRSLGGGVFFELAVHHIDLWRFFLQSEIEEVFATSRTGEWDDEYAAITARMTNGTQVSSVFSERTTECNEIEIYGRRGRLRLSCYEFDGLEYASVFGFPGNLRSRMHGILNTLKEFPQGIRVMLQGGDFLASYRTEWQHFIDAITRNTSPAECTLEDGRRSLEVVLAAIASSYLGKPVKVSEASRNAMPRSSAGVALDGA